MILSEKEGHENHGFCFRYQCICQHYISTVIPYNDACPTGIANNMGRGLDPRLLLSSLFPFLSHDPNTNTPGVAALSP